GVRSIEDGKAPLFEQRVGFVPCPDLERDVGSEQQLEPSPGKRSSQLSGCVDRVRNSAPIDFHPRRDQSWLIADRQLDHAHPVLGTGRRSGTPVGWIRVRDQPDLLEGGLVSQLAGGGEVAVVNRVVGPTHDANAAASGISLAPCGRGSGWGHEVSLPPCGGGSGGGVSARDRKETPRPKSAPSHRRGLRGGPAHRSTPNDRASAGSAPVPRDW